MMKKSKENVMKVKNFMRNFICEEQGDFGIKEIAITVAAIVIIGVIVTAVSGQLQDTWIDELWTYFMEQIKKFAN